jgi:hypothetical protein
MRDLSLHLMDIIQNSISARAQKVDVVINAYKTNDELLVRVSDNGIGMDEEFLNQVINPFVTTRTTRRVGLGISLFKASVERAEGKFIINSIKGKGTEIEATFRISHIDRLPLGKVSDTIVSLILANPQIDFKLIFSNGDGQFEFNTLDIKKILGAVPINEFEALEWIRSFIDEGVKRIFGGVLNEITS